MTDPKNPPFEFKRTTVHRQAVPGMLEGMARADKLAGVKQQRELTFYCTASDMLLIQQIAERGVLLAMEREGVTLQKQNLAMDIATVHCNTTPLHLLQFLMSDNSDFIHDLTGIPLHLDRQTGELFNGWTPIFAVKKT